MPDHGKSEDTLLCQPGRQPHLLANSARFSSTQNTAPFGSRGLDTREHRATRERPDLKCQSFWQKQHSLDTSKWNSQDKKSQSTAECHDKNPCVQKQSTLHLSCLPPSVRWDRTHRVCNQQPSSRGHCKPPDVRR